MTVRHVVRCDECEVEADLVRIQSGMYDVPQTWKQFDGWHFCSYGCVAMYVEAQVKRTEGPNP